MADLEDKKLDFVLKHYQEGKFDTQKAIDRFNEAHGIVNKPRRKALPWVYGIAAAAAAIILGVFLFNGDEVKPIEIRAVAQMREVVLPDGTEVALAPGSKISYQDGSPRKVALSGEAFFEVSRDEEVPFEITADGAYVKVLGTKFLVDASGDDKEVYVTEGKVFFARSSEDEGVVLTKDMHAVLSEYGSLPSVSEKPDVNALAWHRGSFVFDETPLREVLETLAEYYHVSFDATDLDKLLSGEFETDDLDHIIRVIESALDVIIIKKD